MCCSSKLVIPSCLKMSSSVFSGTLCCTILLGILSSHQALAVSAEQKAAIDAAVNELMEVNRTPGLTLALVDNSTENELAVGYGFCNLEDRLRVEDKTRFAIGSITKGVTAILVVRVLSQKFPDLGESALDTPLIKLAPAFDSTFIDLYRHEKTTFRDLLAHRTCLKNPDIQGAFGAFNLSAEQGIYRMRYMPEVCSFRDHYVYNNGMYGLAGEIAASIAGTTYRNLLQTFLNDLGMSDTILYDQAVDYETLADVSRAYYSKDGEILKYNSELLKIVSIVNPAGGILTSSRDMLKYLNFHLKKGKVGEVQIIPEDKMEWLFRPSMSILPSRFKEGDTIESMHYAYAVGFELGSVDSWIFSSHGGSLPPFAGYFTIYPGANIGIFSALNGPNGFVDWAPLHFNIFRILLDETVPPTASIYENGIPVPQRPNDLVQLNPFQPKLTKRTGAKAALSPADLPGTFGNAAYGEAIVRTNGDKLEFSYGKWFTATMKLVNPDDNTFLLEVTNQDLESIMLLQYGGLVENIPDIYMQFRDMNSLWFMEPGNVFVRDEGIDSYPAQPWAVEPEPCSGSTRTAGLNSHLVVFVLASSLLFILKN